MWGVKMPFAARIFEKAVKFAVVTALFVYLQFFAGAHKIGPTIRSKKFDCTPDGEETTQGIDERRRVHRFYSFNVNGACAHTCEYDCPSLSIRLATTCSSDCARPGAEHIKAYMSERRVRGQSVLW